MGDLRRPQAVGGTVAMFTRASYLRRIHDIQALDLPSMGWDSSV
jgi:hypothetical protein